MFGGESWRGPGSDCAYGHAYEEGYEGWVTVEVVRVKGRGFEGCVAEGKELGVGEKGRESGRCTVSFRWQWLIITCCAQRIHGLGNVPHVWMDGWMEGLDIVIRPSR